QTGHHQGSPDVRLGGGEALTIECPPRRRIPMTDLLLSKGDSAFARIATIPASLPGATGFSMWYWNPARRILARSSGPVSPVRAAAGVAPPRHGGSPRIWPMSQ